MGFILILTPNKLDFTIKINIHVPNHTYKTISAILNAMHIVCNAQEVMEIHVKLTCVNKEHIEVDHSVLVTRITNFVIECNSEFGLEDCLYCGESGNANSACSVYKLGYVHNSTWVMKCPDGFYPKITTA